VNCCIDRYEKRSLTSLTTIAVCSVEETEDLASDMLGTSLVVVHDTLVGGKDEDTELTGGEHGVGEIFELLEGKIETG